MTFKTNRTSILETASSHINTDRAATHGDAENSFTNIAGGWNWWIGMRAEGPLTAYDVAMMMVLFKTARAASNTMYADNYIDGSGYLAIAGEIAMHDEYSVSPDVPSTELVTNGDFANGSTGWTKSEGTSVVERAWDLYCKETEGHTDTKDFWDDLSNTAKDYYVARIRKNGRAQKAERT